MWEDKVVRERATRLGHLGAGLALLGTVALLALGVLREGGGGEACISFSIGPREVAAGQKSLFHEHADAVRMHVALSCRRRRQAALAFGRKEEEGAVCQCRRRNNSHLLAGSARLRDDLGVCDSAAQDSVGFGQTQRQGCCREQGGKLKQV